MHFASFKKEKSQVNFHRHSLFLLKKISFFFFISRGTIRKLKKKGPIYKKMTQFLSL